jgi:hypothetical protein
MEQKKYEDALKVLDGNKDPAFVPSVADLRATSCSPRVASTRRAKLAIGEGGAAQLMKNLAETKLNALGAQHGFRLAAALAFAALASGCTRTTRGGVRFQSERPQADAARADHGEGRRARCGRFRRQAGVFHFGPTWRAPCTLPRPRHRRSPRRGFRARTDTKKPLGGVEPPAAVYVGTVKGHRARSVGQGCG